MPAVLPDASGVGDEADDEGITSIAGVVSGSIWFLESIASSLVLTQGLALSCSLL